MNPTVVYSAVSSPLGDLLLTASGRGLSGVYFAGQRWFPTDRTGWVRDDRRLTAAQRWLKDYFAGHAPVFADALDPSGTEFQQAVWRTLQTIPRGSTRTYRQIAEALGRPSAARAAGAAIGRNPISLLVPCHRVVGQDGTLTGYAGGLERKEYLLRLEGAR